MSKNRTSDGLTILNPMVGDDPKMHELIAEESENLRIARQLFELRTAAGLSQLQLAQKIDTTQSVIARLEDADYDDHSLSLLQRIATVLNNRIEVRFVPLTRNGAVA
jgi:DNA-binding XRE family transcriptional regulator